MAFLGKLLKKKSPDERSEEDDELASLAQLEEESKGDLSRFKVSTIKVKEESNSILGEPEAEPSDEVASEELTSDTPQGGGSDDNSTASLLGIFEEEIVVDQRLGGLASVVEDVDAEELAEDLRSLMEELENL